MVSFPKAQCRVCGDYTYSPNFVTSTDYRSFIEYPFKSTKGFVVGKERSFHVRDYVCRECQKITDGYSQPFTDRMLKMFRETSGIAERHALNRLKGRI